MLTLRSYRDYPLAFSGDRGREFLSPPEQREFDELSSGPGKNAWLLSRIATKELVQRYCDFKLNFVPDISSVTLTPLGSHELSITIENQKGQGSPSLQASFATANQYVACCLRPVESGERFAVALKRVESLYPFTDPAKYTASEWDQVRFAAPEEADRILSGLVSAKEALMRVSSDDESLSISLLSLRGDCEVEGPSGIRVHAGCWYFDHHVMSLAFTWRAPHSGPLQGARVEEDPVLPESRHSEITL